MKVSVGLAFPGHLKDESVIWFLCKNFDIKLNIIEASFSMSSGWAILGIEGEKEEVNKVFSYLKDKDIKINKIEEMK